MPSPSQLALCISAALAIAAPWSLAHAAATPVADDSTLNPVVVSATREETDADHASRQVAVVDRQALDSQQPDSVADALKYQSNVEVGGGSRPGAQTPVIRGLSGTRVLQVIDSVRQNTNSGHRGTYFVDPELIQQIEVVKGPASALWGSGALGGVVAVQTRSARDLLTGGEQVGGYVRQGFHSADDKSLTSGALYGQQGQHDWLVSGYYHDSNDIRLGNGQDLTYSAARQHGVMGKYGWQPDDAQRLSLSVRHSQSDQNAPSNPASEVSSSVPLVEQATRDFNTTLDYRLNPADTPGWTAASPPTSTAPISMSTGSKSSSRTTSTTRPWASTAATGPAWAGPTCWAARTFTWTRPGAAGKAATGQSRRTDAAGCGVPTCRPKCPS